MSKTRYTRTAWHGIFITADGKSVHRGRPQRGSTFLGTVTPGVGRNNWKVVQADGTQFSVYGTKADAADVADKGMTMRAFGVDVNHVPSEA